MSNIMNLPTAELSEARNNILAEKLDRQNDILGDIAAKVGTHVSANSWQEVRGILRRQEGNRYFKVGDQFYSEYDGKKIVLEAVDLTDTSMIVQTRDCLINAQFSAAQALFYASDAVSTGVKVFQIDSGKYQFTTTKAIPKGGVVFLHSGSDYVFTRATIYAADRVTPVESDLVVTTSTGTVNLSPVNHQQRCRYGSNNYKESAIRQWLNSDANNWMWTPQTNYDMPSSYGSPEGFLKRLDQELVDVITPREIKVARNTLTDGGGQDTLTDKVFLLSRVEAGLGTEGDTTGETVMSFYDGAPNAKRIKLLDSSPRPWWVRSPYPGYAFSVRRVSVDGAVSSSNAVAAIGLSPAWKIE